ncbi:MAG: alkanesulfonate monooxygenase [Verrucomicrobiales bacterium]|jgi:alkanesulfonate monooxygenase
MSADSALPPAFRVFPLLPRTLDVAQNLKNIDLVGGWCAKHKLEGPLIFNGNDTLTEVWVIAQMLLERYGVSPLVAVNPHFMHPFTVAKMVTSFATAYQKSICLNMITGTALNQAEQLNDTLDHDQKYDRLLEYIEVIQQLTRNGGRPVTFEGEHYTIKELPLNPPIDEQLLPTYFVAGHSEKALEIRDKTGATGMQMLMPDLAEAARKNGAGAIHFGIVTRETEAEARAAAKEQFPEDRRGKHMQDRSMKNTDSAWKRRLKFAAEAPDESDNGYSLSPFRNFQADCPFFVGSHAQVADLLAELATSDVNEFVLDIQLSDAEFENTSHAIKMARGKVSAAESAAAA